MTVLVENSMFKEQTGITLDWEIHFRVNVISAHITVTGNRLFQWRRLDTYPIFGQISFRAMVMDSPHETLITVTHLYLLFEMFSVQYQVRESFCGLLQMYLWIACFFTGFQALQFACSPCVSMGSLWLLQLPFKVQRLS